MAEITIIEKIYKLKVTKHEKKGSVDDIPEMRRVPLELILPIGSGFGYSLDRNGRVTGLKLGAIRENAEEILSLIFKLKSLQRLVIYAGRDLEIPDEISTLTKLEMIWLGGSITRIPKYLFDLNIPLVVLRDKEAFSILAQYLPTWLYEKLAEHASSDSDGSKKHILQIESEEHMLSHPLYPEMQKHLLAVRGLHIRTTDLADPPFEIVIHGKNAVESYFLEREKSSLPLNEVKIILVGNGGAGKTSLVKRLTGEKFNPKETQTHGINIKKWSLPTENNSEAKINFWDFGGQEIMHATHQFFLSKRSIYILVLDGRKDEDPEYWLQHIQSFGGDSPTFVILNKTDEHPAFDLNRKFLLSKYKNIAGFFKVSCSKATGIDELKESIANAIPTTSMFKTLWPYTWFNAKKELESRSSEFISLEQYKNICRKMGVNDQDNQDLLVDFLHDLGVILHFKDIRLLDTHVLNPRWVTEGVYRIINSELVAKNHGTLPLTDLEKCLKKKAPKAFDYPKEKHSFLIDLMMKFELCYKISEETVLIPDLLNIQEPEFEFDTESSLKFIFEYSYLPKSVILRLIVRMHTDIRENTKWRTGLVLKSEEFKAEALIRADEKEKRIYIYVNGNQKRDFFSAIRKTIWEINNSFEKFTVTELVPIPDNDEILIDYQELIGHERSGKEKIFIGRIGKEFNVLKLLNGVESPTGRAESHTIHVEGDYYAAQSQTFNKPTTEQTPQMHHSAQPWEKAVVYGISSILLMSLLFLLIRNEPIADKNLAVGLRIILSFATAALGATIPGLLKVDLSTKGFTIRAAGALALFVITYFATPTVLS